MITDRGHLVDVWNGLLNKTKKAFDRTSVSHARISFFVFSIVGLTEKIIIFQFSVANENFAVIYAILMATFNSF